MTSKPTFIPKSFVDEAIDYLTGPNLPPTESQEAWHSETDDEGHDAHDGPVWHVLVRVVADMLTDINDYESHGKYTWCETDRDTGWAKPRPQGYTGAARKLHIGRSNDVCWWEPWDRKDWCKLGRAEQDKYLSFLRELIEWGHVGVIVELHYLCECCGKFSEVASASLWGIDSLEGDYGREVVGDLIEEALSQADIAITEEATA